MVKYNADEFFSAERDANFAGNYAKAKALAEEIGLNTLASIVNKMLSETNASGNETVTRRNAGFDFSIDTESGKMAYAKGTLITVSGTKQAIPEIQSADEHPCGGDSCPIPGL